MNDSPRNLAKLDNDELLALLQRREISFAEITDEHQRFLEMQRAVGTATVVLRDRDLDGNVICLNQFWQKAAFDIEEGDEFTLDDADLNNLLNVAVDMVKGRANHDVGMYFLDCLERVQKRLQPLETEQPALMAVPATGGMALAQWVVDGQVLARVVSVLGAVLAHPAAQAEDGLRGSVTAARDALLKLMMREKPAAARQAPAADAGLTALLHETLIAVRDSFLTVDATGTSVKPEAHSHRFDEICTALRTFELDAAVRRVASPARKAPVTQTLQA